MRRSSCTTQLPDAGFASSIRLSANASAHGMAYASTPSLSNDASHANIAVHVICDL